MEATQDASLGRPERRPKLQRVRAWMLGSGAALVLGAPVTWWVVLEVLHAEMGNCTGLGCTGGAVIALVWFYALVAVGVVGALMLLVGLVLWRKEHAARRGRP